MEKSLKILICAENPEERKKIADAIFKAGGRRPDEAADGEDALELAKRNVYDIVICDLWIPGIDGIGIIRAIKAKSSETSFILLSPINKHGILIEASEAGADICLLKPFSEASLLWLSHWELYLGKSRSVVSHLESHGFCLWELPSAIVA